jgi:hypothetical protein
MVREFGILLMVCACGCAGAIGNAAKTATQSAIDTATDAKSKEELDALAKSLTDTARDELLSDATRRRLQGIVDAVLADAKVQAVAIRDSLLDERLRADVVALREEILGDSLRALVRRLIDEALGPVTMAEVGAIREELVGAPLQRDLDALIAAEAPKLSAAVHASIDSAVADANKQADAEIAKYKTVVIAIAAVACALLISLGVCIHLIRTHRKILTALIERGAIR